MDRYAPKPNIRRGDEVQVLAGKDRGKRGTVNRMMIKEDVVRVVVGGVNIVKKHSKGRPGVRQAGIIDVEAPMQISNLMLVCRNCGKATRVGKTQLPDGKRARVCKKCKQVIDRSS
jgi:large subunit ribosomal protein L24